MTHDAWHMTHDTWHMTYDIWYYMRPWKTLLLCEPSPCNSSAETSLQPLIWCSESLSSQVSSFPEECFVHRHRYHLSEVLFFPLPFSALRIVVIVLSSGPSGQTCIPKPYKSFSQGTCGPPSIMLFGETHWIRIEYRKWPTNPLEPLSGSKGVCPPPIQFSALSNISPPNIHMVVWLQFHQLWFQANIALRPHHWISPLCEEIRPRQCFVVEIIVGGDWVKSPCELSSIAPLRSRAAQAPPAAARGRPPGREAPINNND